MVSLNIILCRHEEAIALLMEVVRLSPNLPDPYHTLGLLHEAVGNAKKALDFYMIAAHITPKVGCSTVLHAHYYMHYYRNVVRVSAGRAGPGVLHSVVT